jgi:hypothetical protein
MLPLWLPFSLGQNYRVLTRWNTEVSRKSMSIFKARNQATQGSTKSNFWNLCAKCQQHQAQFIGHRGSRRRNAICLNKCLQHTLAKEKVSSVYAHISRERWHSKFRRCNLDIRILTFTEVLCLFLFTMVVKCRFQGI